jgi:transposase
VLWSGRSKNEPKTDTLHRAFGKRDDEYVRTLLIHGARAVLTHGKSSPEWLSELLKRRPKNVAVVAMANKMARTIWALTAHERAYQCGYVSRPA